ALRDQRLRFNELKKIIDGISEKMLAQTLKSLEQDGFIYRQDYAEVPPRVDYQLTDFGREASERLFDLTDWLENNISQLLEQQPRSDLV
ncbi:winged helix-turn-helix transcriptional regulator, partial [Acinetobacter sp. 1475718]|uniref:winged helix-turn-helix transcriptional regulator n=2 Tax=Moraxellaceae TaxID=468 RepID=UPI00045245C4